LLKPTPAAKQCLTVTLSDGFKATALRLLAKITALMQNGSLILAAGFHQCSQQHQFSDDL